MTVVSKVPAVNSKKATTQTSKKATKPTSKEVVKAATANDAWATQMAAITKQQEIEKVAKAKLKAEELAAKKRPGVIASILDYISAAKSPVTQTQILAHLVAEFPKREEKSMTNTIKAQIGGKARPLRMEREKMVIFAIVENKAGVKSYSVALAAPTQPAKPTTELKK